jgi:2-phosphosulfolactate phosphatase
MRIDAYFAIPEVDPATIGDATVVVVDVLRGTTTIIEALANGARAIYPTTSTEDAVKLASSLGRDDTLLCGERRGRKVEGFDLGNSPHEFTAEAVDGMKLVMSTTNGTRALAVGQEGARILPCAFSNIGAVSASVAGDERLVMICAGLDDRFSLDDALCVGHLIRRIGDAGERGHRLNDAARGALWLARGQEPTAAFLEATAAGAALVEIGMGADLEICAEVDRHDIVAEMTDKTITRSGA